jgi:steroid delta-isomerase-like uncharacterized protein
VAGTVRVATVNVSVFIPWEIASGVTLCGAGVDPHRGSRMNRATTDSRELVASYVDAWNEQEFEAVSELVSESVVARNPTAPDGVVRGRDGVEEFMRGVTAAFPDFHVSVSDVLARDDRVMYEAELTMTHEGSFEGISPTGREVEVREMASYHVSDGAIQRYRVYFDRAEVFEQLGVSP